MSSILEAGGSSVWFRLAELVGREVDLIEVRLVATLFATSTSFTAAAQNSRAPGLWQRVDQGDATDLVNSQTSTALAVADNRIIHNLQLSSPAISPNGDGVNDELTFEFSMARISGTVTLTVFDLIGNMVVQISERRSDPRGRYAITWKGDGMNGRLAPAGTYLTRLEARRPNQRRPPPQPPTGPSTSLTDCHPSTTSACGYDNDSPHHILIPAPF